ncbi:TetR/AcrR family transcriptional regulator [Chitinimonas koreensis]|uniref:TetR/AcrR family transcriptional regulator n=1 Tax=Chitinimonas koreensis TaxID=356302 RepID=UPI0003F75F26|nr:TetR/AcrR family transcriptional regulator [Chitinimonas koreensis]QNM96025.1 TetR/AcrR family transcriptional regulator [Chitinimonas koreensis]
MSEPSRLTDRKREDIVAAALAEFRENGFKNTSMDRVAARAAVSKRTVYNHFPSKDELFAEIMLELWRASMAQVDLAYRPGRPLREQLLELAGQKMALLADANFLDLARVAIAEAIHAPERAQAMLARFGEKEEGVTAWVRAAQADGRLRPAEPEFAAQQLQGLLKAFAFWPQIALGQPVPDAAARRAIAESAVDMFLAYHAA